LTGVFIDIDHVIDYFLNRGSRFNPRDFYNCCMELKLQRLSLIFHSYELVAVLWIAIAAFSPGDIWKAAAIGYTQHIILDMARNMSVGKLEWRTYSFIFRMKNGFRTERITKKR
jgi:hypothetical protein